MLAGHAALKLHLGCGPVHKEGWINVDLFGEPDLMLDLREPLPLEDGSCQVIYSEHFFEHVDYPAGAQRILADCLRLLSRAARSASACPIRSGRWRSTPATRQEGYFTASEEGLASDMVRDGAGPHQLSLPPGRPAPVRLRLPDAVPRAGEGGLCERARRPFDPELDSAKRELGTLYVEANRAA